MMKLTKAECLLHSEKYSQRHDKRMQNCLHPFSFCARYCFKMKRRDYGMERFVAGTAELIEAEFGVIYWRPVLFCHEKHRRTKLKGVGNFLLLFFITAIQNFK